ncbi:septation ring formation regulator EzrA [Halobacillus locisalis]|uniref:Septation ring formation regulator EzrA n=1 Tax=Halobacillus locisalis TaxID=220753 RepID=A0A838CMX1_9BACI|nr:septation ring formation regulator EzrA [Halobacillus locisalis]MBA2173321.1 septation ring formation regulator EzrA [Halobacillus locisalis]
MKYVIGGILLLIVLFIVGLIWRKRVYDEVDRLESWKMDIMNRRVTDELSKVKSLNLSGETQEKFEAWRNRWDQILTKELPELEEDLFDAEEAADKYQWNRVKKVIAHTEGKLEGIEQNIKAMFDELEVLLNSEESSRLEMESIQPELKELSKTLIQSRHQFSRAVHVYERRVAELQAQLSDYEQLTDQGDYLEANELAQRTREEVVKLKTDVERFPLFYKKANSELPDQLKELTSGLEEMEQEGYRVSQFEFLPEIHNFERSLSTMVAKLEQGDQEDVEKELTEMENRVQEMYQLLEKEAIAHNYVEKQYGPLKSQLDELDYVLELTEKEIEEIQYTYQLDEKDIETYRSLKTLYNQLKKRLSLVYDKRQDGQTSFVELREELERTQEQMKELKEKQKFFSENVQAVRKDEREAIDKLSSMEQLLLDTHRRLKRSNLPGIPHSLYEDMKEASDRIDDVFQCLDQQPLDMATVSRKLEESVELTEKLHERADQTMETAEFAERVIQYANRYRSQHPLLAAKLLEAEAEFRSYRYDSALKLAGNALNEVDPKAFSRIEEKEQVLA